MDDLYELARKVEPARALRMLWQAESDEERRFWAYIAEMNLQRRQREVVEEIV